MTVFKSGKYKSIEQTAFHLNTGYNVWNCMTQWGLLISQDMVSILPKEDILLVDVIIILLKFICKTHL